MDADGVGTGQATRGSPPPERPSWGSSWAPRSLVAVRELGEVLRHAAVGRAGSDALRVVAAAYRDYATRHPGRYAATCARLPLVTSSTTWRQTRCWR